VLQAACEALTRLGEGRLAQAVTGALGRKSESLGELARLAAKGDRRAIEPLMARLGDENRELRKAACEALGGLGDRRAVEPLIGRLGDTDSDVRRAACKALGRLGDARAVEPLIGRLGNVYPEVRKAACEALGRLADARAVEPLIARLGDNCEDVRLGDNCEDVRKSACEALVAIGLPAVEPLLARLGDEKWLVRRAACETLGKLGDARAVEPLIARLGEKHWDVLQAACEALGRLADPRAVEPLMARLDDKDSAVRRFACAALGRVADARAVEPLIARLTDDDSDVRRMVCEALTHLGEERLATAFSQALAGESGELVGLALVGDLRALGAVVGLAGPSIEPGLKALQGALKSRFSQLWCRRCLARLGWHTTPSGMKWPACRICGETIRVTHLVREAVVVLDENWSEDQTLSDGVLRVNWLKRRAVFDFDRVEIVAATDEDVERFCIQVGNDTDEFRQARYKGMPCRVARQCALSENTLRILRSTFGEMVRA
jgi:HEAT repeat protein